jgi:hypothetical protein
LSAEFVDKTLNAEASFLASYSPAWTSSPVLMKKRAVSAANACSVDQLSFHAARQAAAMALPTILGYL